MSDFVLLVGAMALAGVAGEIFVRGAVALAVVLRVPISVVGLTVAAFATSAPELAVGVNAALSGTPQIAIGDALGSNVVNIGLVLGAVLVIAPLMLSRRDVRRDLPMVIVAPLILGLLTLDGRLDRIDGAVLVTVFVAWAGTTIRHAVRDRYGVPIVTGDQPARRAWAMTGLGIALLLIAGRLVVIAAQGIGETLGLDPFIVGATLVALGTSMPELATAVVSRLRSHGELGAGTVMGSNIFNSLWIVGVVALIRPSALHVDELVVAAIAGAMVGMLLIPSRSLVLGRRRGALLLTGYAAYLVVVVASVS